MSFVSEGVYISAPSSLDYVSQVQHPRRVLTGLTNHCFPQSTAFIPNYFKPLILQTKFITHSSCQLPFFLGSQHWLTTVTRAMVSGHFSGMRPFQGNQLWYFWSPGVMVVTDILRGKRPTTLYIYIVYIHIYFLYVYKYIHTHICIYI